MRERSTPFHRAYHVHSARTVSPVRPRIQKRAEAPSETDSCNKARTADTLPFSVRVQPGSRSRTGVFRPPACAPGFCTIRFYPNSAPEQLWIREYTWAFLPFPRSCRIRRWDRRSAHPSLPPSSVPHMYAPLHRWKEGPPFYIPPGNGWRQNYALSRIPYSCCPKAA